MKLGIELAEGHEKVCMGLYTVRTLHSKEVSKKGSVTKKGKCSHMWKCRDVNTTIRRNSRGGIRGVHIDITKRESIE